MKRVLLAVNAVVLAWCASPAMAGDVCRKFVPSAGVTVEVPCSPQEAATATPDTMERREGHELEGNAYTVVTVSDTAACEQACLADAKCVASEFYQKKNGCGLFDAVPPIKRAKFIDSSIRKAAAGAAAKPKLEAATAVGADRPKWCREQPKFNEAETLVCAQADLAALDMELERVFGVAMAKAATKAERAKLQASEDSWAEMRDACKSNAVCVKAAYQLRIEQLGSQGLTR